MLKRTALFVVVLALAAYPCAPAEALPQPPPGCAFQGLTGTVVCTGSVTTTSGGSGAPPTSGGSGPAPAPTVEVPELVAGGDHGTDCWILVAYPSGSAPTDFLTDIQNEYPPCPAGANPGAAVNPEAVVASFLRRDPLPTPRPDVPPGFAITGKVAYLITGDTNTPPPYTRSTVLGPLTIDATATVTVDWGDGTPTAGPYRTSGGPYPDGSITHTYDDIGRYTIAVRQTWTVAWTLGAAHGTLTDVHTAATLPGFAVRQIQAVITG